MVVGDDDVAEPLLEVLEGRGQAEDRHDLGGDDDVEAILARISIAGTAQADDDVAQRAIVHVHHALPGDPSHVDIQVVAVVDVVVDERGQEVVGEPDGAEVAGEVQVDVLHGHDLGIATAGCAALHAEDRPERGLAQADHRVLADATQAIAQPHGRRGLALARGRWADRRDEDELGLGSLWQRIEVGVGDLGLVVAVWLKRIVGDTERRGDVANPIHLRCLGDFDVAWHAYPFAARTASTIAGMTVETSPMMA